MAYWRLLRSMVSGPPSHSHKEAGSYKGKFCEAHRALVWIYRREWAAYLSFRSRAAPSVFGSPKIASVSIRCSAHSGKLGTVACKQVGKAQISVCTTRGTTH